MQSGMCSLYAMAALIPEVCPPDVGGRGIGAKQDFSARTGNLEPRRSMVSCVYVGRCLIDKGYCCG